MKVACFPFSLSLSSLRVLSKLISLSSLMSLSSSAQSGKIIVIPLSTPTYNVFMHACVCLPGDCGSLCFIVLSVIISRPCWKNAPVHTQTHKPQKPQSLNTVLVFVGSKFLLKPEIHNTCAPRPSSTCGSLVRVTSHGREKRAVS